MQRTTGQEVVLKMKFEEIYGRYTRREMTSEEASIYLTSVRDKEGIEPAY
jgi:hypothetical protein